MALKSHSESPQLRRKKLPPLHNNNKRSSLRHNKPSKLKQLPPRQTSVRHVGAQPLHRTKKTMNNRPCTTCVSIALRRSADLRKSTSATLSPRKSSLTRRTLSLYPSTATKVKSQRPTPPHSSNNRLLLRNSNSSSNRRDALAGSASSLKPTTCHKCNSRACRRPPSRHLERRTTRLQASSTRRARQPITSIKAKGPQSTHQT